MRKIVRHARLLETEVGFTQALILNLLVTPIYQRKYKQQRKFSLYKIICLDHIELNFLLYLILNLTPE